MISIGGQIYVQAEETSCGAVATQVVTRSMMSWTKSLTAGNARSGRSRKTAWRACGRRTSRVVAAGGGRGGGPATRVREDGSSFPPPGRDRQFSPRSPPHWAERGGFPPQEWQFNAGG